MDKDQITEAVDNISLIKGIIYRTSRSFTAFSRIFIYWGFLFILNSAATLFIILNKEQMQDISLRFPLVNWIFPLGIIALAAGLIYRAISQKTPLIGLEKHLMILWLMILILNVLPPRIMIDSAGGALQSVTVHTSNFSPMFFSLAIALIMTSLLTGYRQLKYVGVVYITISVLYAYCNFTPFESTMSQFLSLLALPFTFLYTGLFLRSRTTGGN
jgi:hypothetical protein